MLNTESSLSESAAHIERTCSLIAVSLSQGRRLGSQLVSGERPSFALSPGRNFVCVPYPPPLIHPSNGPILELRMLTCGIAFQCSPSKDRLSEYLLGNLSHTEQAHLSLIEGACALRWISEQWPSLAAVITRIIPDLVASESECSALEMIELAKQHAKTIRKPTVHPLLGQLPGIVTGQNPIMAFAKKVYGRMPWSSNRTLSKGPHTIPVGGEGGENNLSLPPPSKPEEDDLEISRDQRSGIPYPEWNGWKNRFINNYVAVLERKHPPGTPSNRPSSQNLRHWFQQHTYRSMRNRLEDGSDLDINAYISYVVDQKIGTASEPRVFRDLQPAARDVSTAILLDGSSSLGANQGRIFKLELACADALCSAMTSAGERHGLFVFSGNTRHRVDVVCLKDFNDPYHIVPSELGLGVGGYTRLGAPIRHLTRRLLDQASERRLLIIIGDGLMSDEGYEGKYAWADVAHGVEEAEEAGVTLFYIAVGPTRVDPLPEVFGPKRSKRISYVEELPKVLSQVHHELIST